MSLALTITLFIGSIALVWDCLRTSHRKTSRNHAITLGSVMVASLIGRWVFLGQSSLEHLEASYLFEAIKPDSLWDVITSRQAAEQMHQPLYALFLRGWASISLDEAFLRLPSSFWSIACIPLAYGLLREERGPGESMWAAVLVAVSPLLFWYGRDCTPYALLALLSLAAMVSAQQNLKTPKRWLSVRTAICLALAFYTHFHGGWVAVTVVAWLFVSKGGKRLALETAAFTALATLPWIPAMLNKLATSVQGLGEDSAIMRYSHEPLEATSEAFRVLLGSPSLGWIVVMILVIVGTVHLIRVQTRLGTLIGLAILFGLLAEAHILWQLHASKGILYIDVRHYLYLIPLLTAGVVATPIKGPISWATPSAVLVFFLHLAMVLPMATSLEKPDVRSAVALIHSHAASDQAVGTLPAPWYDPIVEHYLLQGCPDLIHARSHDGWWSLDNCSSYETATDGSIFGFPPSPLRLHQAAQRTELKRMWVIDIRDHRFGLAVPPTAPQEQYLCWPCRKKALVQPTLQFGPWVRVDVLDPRIIADCEKPPAPDTNRAIEVVTSAQSWELNCRNFE